jgi:hypothetical protein
MFVSWAGVPDGPRAQLNARVRSAGMSAQHEHCNFFPFSLSLLVLEGEENRGDAVSVSNGTDWSLQFPSA